MAENNKLLKSSNFGILKWCDILTDTIEAKWKAMYPLVIVMMLVVSILTYTNRSQMESNVSSCYSNDACGVYSDLYKQKPKRFSLASCVLSHA